jgi:hypothetical protein
VLHLVDQLGRVERLDDAVVGADVSGERPIGLEGLGREHDDRHLEGALVGPKLGADLVAVHPGHHRVQQDEAGALVERLLQCLLAVLGRDHLKAFETQVDLDEADDVLLVVGDEHYLAHVDSSFGVERSAAWPGSLLVGVSGERRDAQDTGGRHSCLTSPTPGPRRDTSKRPSRPVRDVRAAARRRGLIGPAGADGCDDDLARFPSARRVRD